MDAPECRTVHHQRQIEEKVSVVRLDCRQEAAKLCLKGELVDCVISIELCELHANHDAIH